MDNFSSNLGDFADTLDLLSSGTEDSPTLISTIFSFLSQTGDWAGAVADLIGLVA